MIRFRGRRVDIRRIQQSIDRILESGTEYEFRTTVYPKYVGKINVEKIAKYLKEKGVKEYVLQNYYSKDGKVKPYSKEEIEELVEACSVYLPTRWRGFA